MAKFASEDFICIVTGYPGADIHHIHTRKTRPDLIDKPWNCVPLRHDIHTDVHTQGILRATLKYPAFRTWLLNHGWSWDPVLGRWYHPGSQLIR